MTGRSVKRLRPGRRFLGYAASVAFAAGLLAACSREGGRPLVEADHPRVLTTISAVQSWTAFLLRDIEQPHLLTAREIDAVLESKTRPRESPLEQASLLIAFDGTVDKRAVDAWGEYAEAPETPRPVLTIDSDADGKWLWLDPASAVDCVASLSRELQARYPEKATAIAANEAALRADIQAIGEAMRRQVAAWNGETLLTDGEGLQPMLGFLGMKPVDAFEDIDLAVAMSAESRARVAARAEQSRLRLLASGSIDENPVIAEEAAKLKLRVVGLDPLFEGAMGPGHYVRRMEHNAFILSLALASAESEQP